VKYQLLPQDLAEIQHIVRTYPQSVVVAVGIALMRFAERRQDLVLELVVDVEIEFIETTPAGQLDCGLVRHSHQDSSLCTNELRGTLEGGGKLHVAKAGIGFPDRYIATGPRIFFEELRNMDEGHQGSGA
jgi:hypothetical protein